METIYNNPKSSRNDIGGKILYTRLIDALVRKYGEYIDAVSEGNDEKRNQIAEEIKHQQYMFIYIVSTEGQIFDKKTYTGALNYFASKKLRKPVEYISFIINHYYNGITDIFNEYLQKEEYEKCWIKEFENINDVSQIQIEDFAYGNDFYHPTLGDSEYCKIYSRLRFTDEEFINDFLELNIISLNMLFNSLDSK